MFSTNSTHRPPFWKLALYALLAATCLRVWLGAVPALPRAEAQIPDAGLQRKLLVEETRRTNALLAEIKQVLQAQTLNVRVVGADNQAGHGRADR